MHPMLITALANERIRDRSEEAAKFAAAGESDHDEKNLERRFPLIRGIVARARIG